MTQRKEELICLSVVGQCRLSSSRHPLLSLCPSRLSISQRDIALQLWEFLSPKPQTFWHIVSTVIKASSDFLSPLPHPFSPHPLHLPLWQCLCLEGTRYQRSLFPQPPKTWAWKVRSLPEIHKRVRAERWCLKHIIWWVSGRWRLQTANRFSSVNTFHVCEFSQWEISFSSLIIRASFMYSSSHTTFIFKLCVPLIM